jgi:ligand-binding sensor domain-containing protein
MIPRVRPIIVSASSVAALTLAASSIAHAQARELPIVYWQHTTWTGRAGPPVAGSHLLLGSPDGYLWLSAERSLLRFDGVRFTVLDSADTPALRSNEPGDFVPVFVDRAGVMWISGPGGARITYKDGQFEHAFRLEAGASGPVGEDDRGLIWMSARGPQRFENGRMSPISLPAAVPTTDIWSVRSAIDGGLWI